MVRAAGVELDTVDYDLGGRRYLATGDVLPDAVLDELRGFDAILLGAVGTPEVPPGVLERGLLLKMRFALDLYVNLRPFKAGTEPAQRRRRLPRRAREHRGHLRGRGRFPPARHAATRSRRRVRSTRGWASSAACATRSSSRGPRPRSTCTLVHKTNVLTFAGDLWQRTFDDVAREFADVDTAYNHVDAACIYFVQDPARYDVIVTDNLFGDILTDLGGADRAAGSAGRRRPTSTRPGPGPVLFEPVHGSAPDIAGTGQADPRAAVISAAMMCDFLGESRRCRPNSERRRQDRRCKRHDLADRRRDRRRLLTPR